MPGLHETVLKPVMTEKSSDARSSRGEYTFRVHLAASKQQIREAIEKLWDVTVTEVRTMVVPAKLRRRGKSVGRRPAWKKAVVMLKAGDKIEGIFEE